MNYSFLLQSDDIRFITKLKRLIQNRKTTSFTIKRHYVRWNRYVFVINPSDKAKRVKFKINRKTKIATLTSLILFFQTFHSNVSLHLSDINLVKPAKVIREIGLTQADKNITTFLHILARPESNFNPDAFASYNLSYATITYKGAYQYLGDTRRGIKRKYGFDPATGSLKDQAEKTWRYISLEKPLAAEAVRKGDFRTAYRRLDRIWPTVNGGTQSAFWSKNPKLLRAYERGDFDQKFIVRDNKNDKLYDSGQTIRIAFVE